MLKQRVITALVLLAVLLAAAICPQPSALSGLALFLIAAAGWEWARLNALQSTAALAFAAACAATCAVSWYLGAIAAPMRLLWLVVGTGWVLFAAWLLRAGVGAWAAIAPAARLFGGLFGLWAAWLAIAKTRAAGVNFMFSVLSLVWVADIFAYFTGRMLGKQVFTRKLAPTISPGKTWVGVWGAMVGVSVLAVTWRWLDSVSHTDSPSLYSRLAEVNAFFMVLCVLFLAAMSVAGDLLESLFKRHAGVKDSSALLPGHGGVLDRIDALLPVLPLVMMLLSIGI
jgi:phosphatidate cytidylyltransferase